MFNLLVWFCSLCFSICAVEETDDLLAIVGGTVIDLSAEGASANDIEDSVILIRNGKIAAVGRRVDITIPSEAKILDATGKLVLPGLIDGFAALNNQSYADAFLYMGVTSIIAVSGGRRGELFENPYPGPNIFKLEGVGREPASTEDILQEIEALAQQGYKIILLMYKLEPAQLRAAVEKAHSLGLGTIGELGFTSYTDAVRYGIDAFVHTTRYSLDTAPPEIAPEVAKQPFSDDLDSPKWIYYKYLCSLKADDPRLLCHADVLGGSDVYLMPTMSLLYLDLPDSINPWSEAVAGVINPSDVNNPADKKTGKHTYGPEHAKAYSHLASQVLVIEKAYKKAGVRYLAGSGTDVWGTMPGFSLHTELQLLTRIGLSPREAIAAATFNIAEAFRFDEVGKLEPGRKADILIVGANPLDNIKNLEEIELVIKDGKVLDRAALLK